MRKHFCTYGTFCTYIAVLLLFTALALSVVCCSRKKSRYEEVIMPKGVGVMPGDVLFRRGEGVLSDMVVHVDDGRYSHVGIAVESAGVIMVVHAVPAEPDYIGDPDRVKMDRIETFFGREYAVNGEITRIADRNAAKAAAIEAIRLYRKKVLFDHDYDTSDTTRLYCSELVENAYRKAGVSLAGKRRHDYNVPGFSVMQVITPSDLYASPQLESIIEF